MRKVEKINIKIDNIDAVCYHAIPYNYNIKIPFANCPELIDYLEKKFIYTNGLKVDGKFEIYISNSDLRMLDEALKKISDEYDIPIEDMKEYLWSSQSINGKQLYRTKVCLDKIHKFYINHKENCHLSLDVRIDKIIVYQINKKYHINLLVSKIEYINDNLSAYSIDLDSNGNYKPTVCEVDKLKRGYRTYVSSLKNKIKNKKVKIEL